MAIRDKVTIKFKSGGKAFISEVRRPGGKVDTDFLGSDGQMVRIRQLTRKDQVVDWAAFSVDEIKSIEFERGL